MLAGPIRHVNSSRVSPPKLRISRSPARLIGIKARGAPSSYGFCPVRGKRKCGNVFLSHLAWTVGRMGLRARRKRLNHLNVGNYSVETP